MSSVSCLRCFQNLSEIISGWLVLEEERFWARPTSTKVGTELDKSWNWTPICHLFLSFQLLSLPWCWKYRKAVSIIDISTFFENIDIDKNIEKEIVKISSWLLPLPLSLHGASSNIFTTWCNLHGVSSNTFIAIISLTQFIFKALKLLWTWSSCCQV